MQAIKEEEKTEEDDFKLPADSARGQPNQV